MAKEYISIGKDIAVLWSGGTDSTLLLYELALKAKKEGKKVTALTIQSENVDQGKQLLELNARKNLLEEFAERGLNNIIVETTSITISSTIWSHSGFAQDLMWIISANIALQNHIVYFGYIKDDDYDFEGLHKAASLFDAASIHGRNNNELVLPYKDKTKKEVISKLIEYGLYKHTWFCQLPIEGKCCNHCSSCELHDATLNDLGVKDTFTDLSDYIDDRSKTKKKKSKVNMVNFLKFKKLEDSKKKEKPKSNSKKSKNDKANK